MNAGTRLLKKGVVAAIAAAAVLAATAPAAQGFIPIGTTIAGQTCSDAQTDIVQVSSSTFNTYVVPVDGTITSWSTEQSGPLTPGVAWKMKIFRPTGGNLGYQVVGSDGPRVLTPNARNTFTSTVPVKAGDLLGLNRGAGDSNCGTATPNGLFAALTPTSDLAVGSSATFNTVANGVLNISATIEPLNTVTFGAAVRNKKKGSALLTVAVPGAGTVRLAGAGVKAVDSFASAKGNVTFPVRAQGKARAKLRAKGKVNVSPAVTFTPTSGTPGTQSTTLKLKLG